MSKATFAEKLTNCTGPQFVSFYSACCDVFRSEGCLFPVHGDKCKVLNWPDGVGAYVVWKTASSKPHELLYVGMTGKVKTLSGGGAALSGSHNSLRKRALRYHPYCFTSGGRYKDHFEFGPLHPLKTILKAPAEKRYFFHVPLRDVLVECFTLPPRLRVAPTFVEALILQQYFASEGRLPPGNNAF